ncbi:MAG: transcription antitermination protein NusB [Candidatus Caenarcaniphilales bacterium]|nr:transcription antitermination protein NusB [Candidatus Caenarcaniphilales bacterium]
MNSRTAGRNLAFLALSHVTRSTELTPDKLILAATRTLKDYSKHKIRQVQKELESLGNYFFNESLTEAESNVSTSLDFKKIHEQVGKLEDAAFSIEEALDLPEILNQSNEAYEYAVRLIDFFRKNKDKINNVISEVLELKKKEANSKGWSFERVLSTDRLVLKIATVEILSMDDCPSVVVIDEALKLSEKYGSEDSPKFVNGVLVDIVKSLKSGSSN